MVGFPMLAGTMSALKGLGGAEGGPAFRGHHVHVHTDMHIAARQPGELLPQFPTGQSGVHD